MMCMYGIFRHNILTCVSTQKVESYYNSSRVCVCVRNQSPPRSFDGSSPHLVGVCRWTSELPLRGSFSKRSTGRWLNGSLSLSTILYRDQPHTTQLQKAPFALVPQLQSLIRSAPFARRVNFLVFPNMHKSESDTFLCLCLYFLLL